VREEPPSWAWLAGNYGVAAAVGVLAVFFDVLVPLPTFPERLTAYRLVYVAYELVVLALCVRALARIARRGAWRPGGGVIVLRWADVALLTAAVLAITGALVLIARQRASDPRLWLLVDGVMGIAVTVPIAARFLGEVVRAAVFIALAALATISVSLASSALASAVSPVQLHAVELGGTALLVVAVMLLQPRISEAIDGLVFRRSRRRRLELQAFVHGLSPELGTLECCRRATAEVIRVEQLRGAAIILRDGETVAVGEIDLAPVRDVWPTGEAADALPAQALGDYGLHGLPLALREALGETSIVAIIPIASPRGRQGHLLLSTGLLGAYFPQQDVDTLHAFADQLALVLDAAGLLARAVAVERSHAHPGNLGAIGELAARIAHEIRNPVTSAKSLAQQLASEPEARFAEEHTLILAELARVERLVADLLRFARRDEIRRERTDVGQLVRETLAGFSARLEAGHVQLVLEAVEPVVAEVDREKLRRVVLNLVENALDAMQGREHGALTVSVGTRNGCIAIGVRDDGPGVPADALPHLFEPFFSQKPHGTGLGLAIVQRIVEAHHGTIAARSIPGSGLSLDIDIPLMVAS
jgi:signal transduction histidine kinase